jgi:hypothetical protein
MKQKNCLHSSLIVALSAVLLVSAAHAADYRSTVLSDNPVAYYRLGDVPPADVAKNTGTLGAAGNGTYIGAGHRAVGALAGNGNAAASFDGSGARVAVPFNAALNPSASNPFTIEAWVMPTIDGLANAQAPLFNRHSAGNRQGWVFFQRGSGTGFNFRMYNENGSSQSVDITGGPYTVGAWTHLVATWNGTTATLYVNGVSVGSQTAAYVANTDAPFSVGAYGANNPGDNPYTGAIDEVAFYQTALSASQILAHYQNGTNAARSTPYETVVALDGAVEYLRLNEASPIVDTAINSGSMGAAADGLHFPGMTHQVPGAIVGDTDAAAGYTAVDVNSTDGGVPTVIPYNPALNTSSSFTIEAWMKPTIDAASNQQCPLVNRITDSGGAFLNRAGWDFFQQPSGTGWRFRMFNGAGSDKLFTLIGGPYTVGTWNHVVAVYNAAVPSCTLYVNGASVASSSSPNGSYAPNPSGPIAIGGLPQYSNGHWENPFTGSMDEVALYTNALSGAQVLAHYQNGTNALRVTPYSSLVLSDGAAGYWRLGEPARNVATNSGTLGAAANGTYAYVTNNINNQVDLVYFSGPNSVAGPQSPAYAGFESTNLGTLMSGSTNYIELLNPAGLNFSGQISLEAWVLPDASQGSESYFLAHGYNDDGTAEDVLRIETGNYYVGSYSSVGHSTSIPVPLADLGGGNWIHVVGTYNGSAWNIYRNGALAATTTDATGALPVNNANWAVGARGRWKYATGLDRLFTGAIDEPAIYNTALSPSRVRAHYFIGKYATLTPPHPTLTITPDNSGNVILTWSDGVLQQADIVTGGYTDLLDAVSPYSVPATDARKFFRVRL